MVSHRRRPPLRELAKLASGFAPFAVRRALWRWREPPYQDWLTPKARHAYGRALGTEMAADPLRWDDYLHLMRRRRSAGLGLDTMTRLAAGQGASFAAPFYDSVFLEALARLGGSRGLGGRTSVMTALFADLLAPAIISRTTKATFGTVFWGPASRQFARSWSGDGVDPSLVDIERLRAAWLAPSPSSVLRYRSTPPGSANLRGDTLTRTFGGEERDTLVASRTRLMPRRVSPAEKAGLGEWYERGRFVDFDCSRWSSPPPPSDWDLPGARPSGDSNRQPSRAEG